MEAMVKSIPVYYEEYGTGIPLLLLHGLPGDNRGWIAGLEPLFQNRPGWRRIYPDLPGMGGETPVAEWITNNDLMLEVVAEFMQTVAPNQRFVIAGGSYGAYIAQGLVYRQGTSIDGVYLLIPLVETDRAKRQLPIFQVLHEDPLFLTELTSEESFLRNLFVVQNYEVLKVFRNQAQLALKTAELTFLEKLRANFDFSFPVDQLTAPFQAPALIVAGLQDSIVGYKDAWSILDNYPRATFAVLDRAGHLLHIEQESLLQSLTNEWLDRVEECIAKTSA
jgi:pimeloyl-ACP methyl ester carboxylesterase